MATKSEKDKLRSSVIDELITADNWFTLVADNDRVKVFSCTNPAVLKREIVTIMLQEKDYANLFVDAVSDYVSKCRKIELNKLSLN